MQHLFRHLTLFLALIAAVFLWHPMSGHADPVTDALEKALESAKQDMNTNSPQSGSTENSEPAEQPDAGEAENSAPLQGTYPDVENLALRTGGNGDPASVIWYPHVGNEKVDKLLREFAEAQSREYDNEVRDGLGENGEKPESWSTWEQTGFFTLERPQPDILSVMFNIYSYIGGAHGQLAVTVLNFDLKTGRQLGFNDLFGNPQKALAIMSELTAGKLRKNLGEDADEDMIRDGTEPTEANFSNLSLLPGGLAVEFQPYQVGPWSIGQQQVDLSLEELAPAAPNPAIWPKLADSSASANS